MPLVTHRLDAASALLAKEAMTVQHVGIVIILIKMIMEDYTYLSLEHFADLHSM